MKLLLFLEHHFFNIDGEVYCDRIINHDYLTRYLDSFDEVVVCGRFSNNVPKKKMKVSGDGVSFLPLPDFQGSSGIIKNYRTIRNILKKNIHKYDAILLRAPSPISFVAHDIVKSSHIPYAAEIVVNPKTMFCKDSCSSKLRPLISWLFVRHTKSLCKNANGVSYVTEKVLQTEFPCKALKLKDPSYFTDHYSSIDLHDYQFTYKVPQKNKKDFSIVHTGYMDSYSKGHKQVIDVASILVESGYDVNVIFIGTGNLEGEFKEYAKSKKIFEKITFCGSLNGYSEVQKQLLRADCFLFPTCSEGLPRSLIEAMANSLPCISSPIDGITELLERKYLIDYKDTQEMAKSIKMLIDDFNIRTEAGLRNYNKAQEYRYDVIRERRKKFYNQLRNLCK
ncbi:glycosyltransferase [Holdemanella biformis]